MSYDGADKREVNQRGDKAGEPSGDTAIGMDFNVAWFVGIGR